MNTRKLAPVIVRLCAFAGGLYFALVMLTPSFGKIVGFADQQPPLHRVAPNTDKPLRLARRLRARFGNWCQ